MSRRPQLAVLSAVLLAGVLAVAYKYRHPLQDALRKRKEHAERAITRLGGLEIVLEDAPPETVFDPRADALPDYLDAIHRLRPDRRFLFAAAEIDRLLSGDRSFRKVSIRFEEERWNVRYGRRDVGSLPRIPTYAEEMAFLSAWAAQEGRRFNLARNDSDSPESASLARSIDGASPEALFGILADVNALWERYPGRPDLLRIGCRSLVWLQLQTYDELQLTDSLLGKALALLALAHQGEPESLVPEEAILASRLGYQSAAATLSARLSPTDVVRRFCEEDPKLQSSRLAGMSPRDQYLTLMRAVEKTEYPEWLARKAESVWAEAQTSALALDMLHDDFQSADARALSLAMDTVSRIMPRPSFANPEGHLKEIEAALEKRADRLSGRVFDRASIESSYRANLYSALHARARFLLDKLSSTDEAAAYAMTMSDPPAGTASELRKWVEDRVAYRQVAGEKVLIATDLGRFRNLGIVPLARIRRGLRLYARPGQPEGRAVMRGYLEGMDTRPSNLAEAALVANLNLVDLALEQRYMAAAANAAPWQIGRLLPFYRMMSGDLDDVKRIASSAEIPRSVRAEALSVLRTLSKPDVDFVTDQLLGLVGGADDLYATLECIQVFETAGQAEKALGVTTRWYAAHPGKRDLSWATVATRHAALLRQLGRLDEALRVALPAAETGQYEAQVELARVHASMGDLETALGIATAVRERYPESGDGDVVMAEILWRMKKPAEAAATLAAARKRFGASTMAVQAAPAFVRVYLRGNPEEAKLAFGELVSRKFVWSNDLEPIVDGIRSGGEPGRALQLLEKARGEGAEGAGLVLEGYELACEVSGRDEGLQWLRRRVPQPNQQFAIVAFQLGYHSLLWDLFPNPEVEKQPEILLLRAAALVSDGRSRTDSRWRETEAALSAASKESEFASEARYLMGMTGREAVLRIAGRGRGKLCTAAWALGLRAAADGHFREASDWLQISVESGTMAEPPFAFSWDLLLLWHAANRFLPTAAEQKGLVLYRRPTEREATASTR